LSWLAVATVLLGAVAALAQTDLKRMLAYSSVNHLGYCALAIAAAAAVQTDRAALAAALSGTVLQAFNHGIIASTLFFGIAVLEVRSRGQRGLNDFGGLRAQTPVFCGAFGVAVFASVGLPGLSGFVGEFLIFNGAFALTPAATAVSVLGLLLTAVFLLRMIRKVFSGPLKPSLAKWPDLSNPERWVFGTAILLIVAFGVNPQMLLRFANPGIVELLDLLSPLP
jgi:NADH-quinone oxidoreductase subunit M